MTFTLAHAVWMLTLGIVSWVGRDARIAAVGGAASLVVLAMRSAGRWTPSSDRFGAANAITTLRIGMVILLSAIPASPRAAILLVAMFALDGVDGAVARRYDEASEFGAQFDMETDALTVLVAGLVIAASGTVGTFIVLPGFFRYLYAIAIHITPGSRGEAPRSTLGRNAFVVLMLSLVVCLVPVTSLEEPIAVLSTVLVAFSFARSFYWTFADAGVARPPAGRFVEDRDGER